MAGTKTENSLSYSLGLSCGGLLYFLVSIPLDIRHGRRVRACSAGLGCGFSCPSAAIFVLPFDLPFERASRPALLSPLFSRLISPLPALVAGFSTSLVSKIRAWGYFSPVAAGALGRGGGHPPHPPLPRCAVACFEVSTRCPACVLFRNLWVCFLGSLGCSFICAVIPAQSRKRIGFAGVPAGLCGLGIFAFEKKALCGLG